MTPNGLPTWWTREFKTSSQLQHGNLWNVFVHIVAKHLSQKENVLEHFCGHRLGANSSYKNLLCFMIRPTAARSSLDQSPLPGATQPKKRRPTA